ncbi:MAG: hypothetical protein HZA03_09675 [Nitrospinae bacterium]|nr:hypothetical protein [Nitrospinota bacterium]
MIIKNAGYDRSHLTNFDLLGSDEVGLSKAFAYTLGHEPKFLYKFLRFIGLKVKFNLGNFQQVEISTEKVVKEGRIDINIYRKKTFQVIIECKVRKNRIGKQKTQYLSAFEKDAKHRILCFIAQENSSRKSSSGNIRVVDLTWSDVLSAFDEKSFWDNQIAGNFFRFALRGFAMRSRKEILVQDLGRAEEVRKFYECLVYRRNVIFGNPQYFAPHFTRSAKQEKGEGIPCVARILGILTVAPRNIGQFKTDLMRFAEEKGNKAPECVERWMDGVKKDKGAKEYTYFFLDEPVYLKVPLKKDGTIKPGRGKNWIAAAIPPNRCVTFEEFLRRIVKTC